MRVETRQAAKPISRSYFQEHASRSFQQLLQPSRELHCVAQMLSPIIRIGCFCGDNPRTGQIRECHGIFGEFSFKLLTTSANGSIIGPIISEWKACEV